LITGGIQTRRNGIIRQGRAKKMKILQARQQAKQQNQVSRKPAKIKHAIAA
jgi:hypothetical protein